MLLSFLYIKSGNEPWNIPQKIPEMAIKRNVIIKSHFGSDIFDHNLLYINVLIMLYEEVYITCISIGNFMNPVLIVIKGETLPESTSADKVVFVRVHSWVICAL